MRAVLDQVPHLNLDELIARFLRGIVVDRETVFVKKTGLLGADLEFGNWEGI